MRIRAGGLAVLMVLVSVAGAYAQGPGGGRFGGRGGFCSPVGPGSGGKLGLLRVEAVQEELELSDDQKEEIRELGRELRGQRGERGERPNFRDLSADERRRMVEERRQEAEERAKQENEKLAEILMPNQVERLNEIQIQVMGVRALQNEEVASKLELSDEQKQKVEESLRQAGENMRDEMREAFQSGDREQIREKMEEVRAKNEKEVLAVLSAEQQQKWEEMKGEKFDMPQGAMFGGRGGRDGQRGPRGQRGEGRPRRPQN